MCSGSTDEVDSIWKVAQLTVENMGLKSRGIM